MFSEIQLWVVATLVAVLEAVVGVGEGVGNVSIVSPASSTIYFERNRISHPFPAAVWYPAHNGEFPVGFVTDVFFKVHSVINFL